MGVYVIVFFLLLIGIPLLVLLFNKIRSNVGIKQLANIRVGDFYRVFFDLSESKDKAFWDVQIVEIDAATIRYRWADGKVSRIGKLDFFTFPFKKLEK